MSWRTLTYLGESMLLIPTAVIIAWYFTALMTVMVFRAPSRQVPLLASCVLGTTLANLLVIGPALSNVKFAILNQYGAGHSRWADAVCAAGPQSATQLTG